MLLDWPQDLETEDHMGTGQGSMAQGKELQCCLYMDGNMGDKSTTRTCFVKTYDLTPAWVELVYYCMDGGSADQGRTTT